MFKEITIYNRIMRLKRVKHRNIVVWTNDPEGVLKDLKRIDAGREEVVKTTKSIFNRSFTK